MSNSVLKYFKHHFVRNLLNFEIFNASFLFKISRNYIKFSSLIRNLQDKNYAKKHNNNKIIKKLKKLHLNKIIRKNNSIIILLTILSIVINTRIYFDFTESLSKHGAKRSCFHLLRERILYRLINR